MRLWNNIWLFLYSVLVLVETMSFWQIWSSCFPSSGTEGSSSTKRRTFPFYFTNTRTVYLVRKPWALDANRISGWCRIAACYLWTAHTSNLTSTSCHHAIHNLPIISSKWTFIFLLKCYEDTDLVLITS